MSRRTWKVYVVPPSVGEGRGRREIRDESGAIDASVLRNPTSPSFVRIKTEAASNAASAGSTEDGASK